MPTSLPPNTQAESGEELQYQAMQPALVGQTQGQQQVRIQREKHAQQRLLRGFLGCAALAERLQHHKHQLVAGVGLEESPQCEPLSLTAVALYAGSSQWLD